MISVAFERCRDHARRALNDHTYVSKAADLCPPVTACRMFVLCNHADRGLRHNIDMIPRNYGWVTINKSISIVADGGGPAGIFITGGTAITINAGPTDIVNLRGLTLDGAGLADSGIAVGFANTGNPGTLTITDCFIRHFNFNNIGLGGNSGLTFVISNTVSSDSNGPGLSMGGFHPIKRCC